MSHFRSFTGFARARRSSIGLWDAFALGLLFAALIAILRGGHETLAPLSALKASPVSLDPSMLPEYALRTTLRMLAALFASLVFTLIYGTLAARSRRAGQVLIPILDILQSVPILGFLSFTVTAFMALFPGRVLGVECAAIFAIFTSQAWNMTFSFYQSLGTVPRDLEEVSRAFGLSSWQRFWRLDVPFAIPGLVWNAMMSMSGGWFFVVASEAISVGNTTYSLPGIGSYVALAIAQQDVPALVWAVAAMFVVILLTDQLLFRPLVAWSDKFRVELSSSGQSERSWFLDALRRARLLQRGLAPLKRLVAMVPRLALRSPALPQRVTRVWESMWIDRAWFALIALIAATGLWQILRFIATGPGWQEVAQVIALGGLTLMRVIVLMAVASMIWVPVGIWIGLRPHLAVRVQPLAQFLAAFPANIVFPFAVLGIVHFGLNADIWLSPLMVLGTQWYILFNVIAGASAFPNDLREASASFRITGWTWWRRAILPAIFPYYITGAITASGGSWNAAIVAEIVSWGQTTLTAHGLGSYIAQATAAGDYPRIVLGVAVMAAFVILFNRLFWHPLYAFAGRRLRLD